MITKAPTLEAKLCLRLSEPPRLLSADDTIEELLGFKPEEFISDHISLLDRIHPHDREDAADRLLLNSTQRSGIFHLRLRHADGGIRCLCTQFEKTRRDSGELLEIILRDVKSLWKGGLEGSLSGQCRAVMENTDDFIYFKDGNHVYTGASRNVHALAESLRPGCPLLGSTDYDIFPEELADVYYRLEQQIFSGVPVAHEVQQNRMPDGKSGWVDNRKYPLRDENGEIIGLFGVARDITAFIESERALRESKEVLQLFIEHAPAALAMFDREMRYLAASRRWLIDYGIAGIDVAGRSHFELARELPEVWREIQRRCLAGEILRNDEQRVDRPDDVVQWVRWEARPWRTEDGGVGGIVIFGEDITGAKQAEDRLKLAASVFTNAREAIMITDAKGVILEVNDTFTRISGYSREEVLGRNPKLLSSGQYTREFYADMWNALLSRGKWSGEIWNRAKSGEIFVAMETITAVTDSEGKALRYVAMLSDITLLKEQERKLEQIAYYDALTGLPNRAHFTERLRHLMLESSTHSRIAVAYFDLDGFKAINDAYGREIGNALLAAIATNMKRVLRDGDIVARIGGDEFVALLSHLEGTEDAIIPLMRLMRAAAEPVALAELILQISASAGLALFPQSIEIDADQLIRQADRAMYQAKLAGKNRFQIFNPTQDSVLRSHLEVVEDVRRALHAREMVLYYQPKVNMARGTVIGAEALIRWQHPWRGLLMPAHFLPAVEEHPLAIELGEWVLDAALTQIERWRANGLDIPVSVNVGARQLQAPDFLDRLRALLAAHPAVSPTDLELELLETSALMDVAQVSQLIEECRKLGVSVALDDFGTGYSSLTYLKRLPANVLKIDQSFIRDMLSDPEDLAILEGVLGLATAFRRHAIAEGVETVDHGIILLQLGCELAQGFGIARPMPAEEFPGWLSTWKPDPRWANAEPLSPADWPVLYAGVEHRAWINLLALFLKRELPNPPTLEAEQCRLGAWLAAERAGARGSMPAFKAIEQLHLKVHSLADQVVALRSEGRFADARDRFSEIDPLFELALQKLRALVMKKHAVRDTNPRQPRPVAQAHAR